MIEGTNTLVVKDWLEATAPSIRSELKKLFRLAQTSLGLKSFCEFIRDFIRSKIDKFLTKAGG